MIKNILYVALGGGAGSVLRYLGSRFIQSSSGSPFPLGTFSVNIAGSLLIGILWGLAAKQESLNREITLLLMTGLCGGFTTFSSFSLESLGLLRENKTGLFMIYIAGSIILGLLATYAGIRITK